MAWTWYYVRYRPQAFIAEQKATCRQCGERIHFLYAQDQNTSSTYGIWAHEGENELFFADTVPKPEGWHYACPKEFCNELVTSDNYDRCGRPVKYENIQSEDYACGMHMRSWSEAKAAEARRIKIQQEREEKDAIAEYEIGQYDAAAQWIIDQGFGDLVKGYVFRKEQARHYARVQKEVEIDLFVLKGFLESIIERLANVSHT